MGYSLMSIGTGKSTARLRDVAVTSMTTANSFTKNHVSKHSVQIFTDLLSFRPV